ncbi:MAG: DNA cytosine methyltransferase [Actinomycetota bacterium]
MAVASGGLSVFSGLGGLDLGARIAGLRMDLATDQDEEALKLLKSATGIRCHLGGIDEALAGPLVKAWGTRGSPRCLIGGPPCTPFSHAGFWIEDKRAGEDPAHSLLESYVDCLKVFKPDAFVLENVPGLVFKTHRRFLDSLVAKARRLRYHVATQVLRASDFGVAQSRRRLFIVGLRDSQRVDLSTWSEWPTRSSEWAIGDLEHEGIAEPDEQPGAKYRELLQKVPPGKNYLHFTHKHGWTPPEFKYRGRYWSFLLKLDPSQPAPTIPAQRITYNGPFHWTSRHLRVQELARLQSLPDWYGLSSDLPTARRHIGNAVPPLMAAAVIWRVRQALGDAPKDTLPAALDKATDSTASFANITSLYPRVRSSQERTPSSSIQR